MTKRRGVVTAVFGLIVAASSITGAVGVSAAKSPTITVIAQGLNNPRGLAWGPDGALIVAESGTAGTFCIPGAGGTTCLGTTGSISRIVNGHVNRFVTGLISVGPPGGQGSTGPDGLSWRDDGSLYTIMTGAPQVIPPGAPRTPLIDALHDQLGQLIKVGRDGAFQPVAPVGQFDYAWAARHPSINPQYPDANPYGVLALENTIYVVDAGSNTLDRVGPDGKVTILALFPNPPVNDAVPTCLDRGRDGALYVGELTGGGNPPGSAVVWRVVPGEKPTVWLSGFSNITGCGFGADGSFYVTEFQTGPLGSANPSGDVIRISEDGHRTSLGQGKVFLANGFLAGKDGSVYVSNWSVLTGTSTGGSPTGEVIRITP
jgi:sugar lactone lactonase YvrE